MRKVVPILVSILFLPTGCKTVYVPVESTKMEYIDRTRHDSIHIHDSVFIQEKGDTVWLTRWRTEYRDRIRIDSILIRDSISVPYPVEVSKSVEKTLSRWQKMKMELGGIALGLLLGIAIYFVVKGVSIFKTMGWKGLINKLFHI